MPPLKPLLNVLNHLGRHMSLLPEYVRSLKHLLIPAISLNDYIRKRLATFQDTNDKIKITI